MYLPDAVSGLIGVTGAGLDLDRTEFARIVEANVPIAAGDGTGFKLQAHETRRVITDHVSTANTVKVGNRLALTVTPEATGAEAIVVFWNIIPEP